jgi:predicted O-methyltransferase YrrM
MRAVSFCTDKELFKNIIMNFVKHVIKCFNLANTFDTKLTREAVYMEGMSGIKTRIFYNHLCALEFPGRPTYYLEVGTWKGSTICSALQFNENCHGTVIENWALFGGPKTDFLENIKNFGIDGRLTIFEEDVFSFDTSKIKNKIDIYLYDGDHDETSHYKGITHIWPVIADEAIIIVDDWNAPHVRKGTLDGLRDVGANIIEKFEIMYTNDGSHTRMDVAQREFWNGIAVFVVSKLGDVPPSGHETTA